MTSRSLSTVAIQFGQKYEAEKMRVLVDHLNRLTTEFQKVIRVLSGGVAEQVLTKVTGADYSIEWATGGGGGDACCDGPIIVSVADPTLPNARVFVADTNYFTLTDDGPGGDLTLSLAPNGITYDRIQEVAGRSVLGNPTGVAGDVQEITATVNGTVLTLVSGVLQFASFAVVVASYFTDSAEIAWTYDSGTDTISAALVANSVNFDKLQQISSGSILGRSTVGIGDIEELTGTQVTALLDVFTDALNGLVPAPITEEGRFLRDDGTWGFGSGVTIQQSWRFNSGITAVDPGTKKFSMNNTLVASVTEIYFNDTTIEGFDSSYLMGFLEAGYRIFIQQSNTPARVALFEISAPATDNGGWWTVPVTVVNSVNTYVGNEVCFGVFMLSGGGGGGSVTSVTGDGGVDVDNTDPANPIVSIDPTLSFLTENDDTALLPGSRQVLAGDNIAFDDTTPGERTISSSGGYPPELGYAGIF